VASILDWLLPKQFFTKLFVGSSSACETLTQEGVTYFGQLVGEYKLLSKPPASLAPAAPGASGIASPPPSAVGSNCQDQIREIADSMIRKPLPEITWSDLFQLEKCILRLQSDKTIRQRAWALRSKFKDIAGEKEYDIYLASHPPDPQAGDIDALRADMEAILSEFHWIYAFAPVRERMRNKLGIRVFLITLALVLVASVLAWYSYSPTKVSGGETSMLRELPVLPIIMAMGMLGAFLSLQRRIQAVPSTGDPIVNISELTNSRFSVYIAPVSGAIFAVLLYIIFIGGLLKGPLFPAISTPDGKCETPQPARSAVVHTPEPSKSSNAVEKIDSVENTKTATGSSNDVQPSTSGKKLLTTKLPESLSKAVVAKEAAPNDSKEEIENARRTNSESQKPSTSEPVQKQAPQTEVHSESDCLKTMSFHEFISQTAPASGLQFAILLVWSFVAGFAERFVPDTIDRLMAQSAGGNSAPR
jgi:hypothetical protein